MHRPSHEAASTVGGNLQVLLTVGIEVRLSSWHCIELHSSSLLHGQKLFVQCSAQPVLSPQLSLPPATQVRPISQSVEGQGPSLSLPILDKAFASLATQMGLQFPYRRVSSAIAQKHTPKRANGQHSEMCSVAGLKKERC